ncbi:MAG: hypothetical protein HQL38_03740 [Alphaproteobacteria bacterium]|nr:hypothetical protein [Alphaproteobacteria bacterium]MBF0391773.1 hypothetical protein [Alphaproteobacteria bacterium]
MIGTGDCGLSLAFVAIGVLIGGFAVLGGTELGGAVFLGAPMLMMGLVHCLMLRKVLRRGPVPQLDELRPRREF